MSRYELTVEADPDVVRARLRTKLGRPVEVVMRQPVGDEPGVLIVEDEDGVAELDVPTGVIAEVTTNAKAPPSNGRRALAEYDAALTPAGKLKALRDYIERAENERDQAAAKSKAAAQSQALHQLRATGAR